MSSPEERIIMRQLGHMYGQIVFFLTFGARLLVWCFFGGL